MASKALATASRAIFRTSQRSAARACVPQTPTFPAVRLAPTLLQSRTLFGFGTPAPELPAQMEVPWYKRKPEDDYAQHEPTITAEERQERIAMTDEILACHENGSVPDLDLYNRLINMLIKWNDREGVLNARNLAVELDVEFDDALTRKVEEYLAVAEREAWRV